MRGADRRTLPVIELRGVTKTYLRGRDRIDALRGVDLTVAEGEYLGVAGPSGSGKSTLFNLIGGMDQPTAGEVWVCGENLAGLGRTEAARVRQKQLGFVFQSYHLLPKLTALENCMLPMLLAGVQVRAARKRAMDLLGLTGLGHRLHHRPAELSGGQQQRVAIARALANRPAILLADEPTGNLDLNTGREIAVILQRLNADQGVTMISATHDLTMLEACTRVIHLNAGIIDHVEQRVAGGAP